MAIANKIQNCIEQSSWIRKMFEQGDLLRQKFGPENIFDFTIGNPSVEPPQDFYDELKNIANNPATGMHRYMSNAGYTETRTAVAEFLTMRSDSTVDAAQIIMTCGAGGALNVVLKTILNPADEVIILAPYFVEYKFYIDNHGGTPIVVETKADDFQLDIPTIAQAINRNTKAIIINSPNNPTGVIYPANTLCALNEMLQQKQQEFDSTIYVISDEPYARLAYDNIDVPCVFNCIENSIIVTSHSKDLALPGERIGYLAVNPAMPDITTFMNGAIFSNRVLGFVNAPALAQRLVTKLQHTSVDISEYEDKRDLFYQELIALGFEVVKPQGGFYLFPKSPLDDDAEFVQKAQEYNILLVPGKGFGAPGYFRIAYCVDKEMIERSLPAWKKLAADVGLK
ncbi:MAG: pyridoxal phosphate-dependent aminotransferase [Thermodesulfobacteriota bacterium]|nr:pyridoxal phosphate-dependent aminotransferase [Thermodesulfobacteriota bacterium]